MLYKNLLRPLFFKLDPELAHEIVLNTGKCFQWTPGGLALLHLINDLKSSKSKTLWGKSFSHPVGLAAGFDKNAELVPFLHALGFSFVEVGSVTYQASLGNPRPRIFRLKEDRALINRMGLNNSGATSISKSLQKNVWPCPVGINISKTHSPKILGDDGILDICQSYTLLQNKADYICLNISCPNTLEGKTFEDLGLLKTLLQEIQKIRGNTPLVLKLSPDLNFSDFDEILKITQDFSLSGLVLGNTSQNRETLKTDCSHIGRGGLSGSPLFNSTYQKLIFARQKLPSTFVIMACGGIHSEKRAKLCLDAGADLLQIYTGLIYEGPSLIKRLRDV